MVNTVVTAMEERMSDEQAVRQPRSTEKRLRKGSPEAREGPAKERAENSLCKMQVKFK